MYTLLWSLLPCGERKTADLRLLLPRDQCSQPLTSTSATSPHQSQYEELWADAIGREDPFCLDQPCRDDQGPAGSHCGGAGGLGDVAAATTPEEAELLGPDFIGCHHQEDVLENMEPKSH